MFNFIRWTFRRVHIIILLFMESFFEVVKSICSDDGSPNWLEECAPIRSNRELIDYVERPFSWINLVEPLATRCCPRKYGDQYSTIHETENSSFEFPEEKIRPKVLVCHDMAGNYRGDRFIHGSKKFDDYRFYHWGGIDIFVYFSHNYVTIPPLSWINAGHRNGVLVLGTIIIEFDAAKHLLDGLLRSKHDTNRYVEALVLVTKNFGFDGWLLNIECRADRDQVPLLKAFTRQLTARIHDEIPNGIVLWYDSVTEAGRLDWQNEVNEKNIGMYKDVSDGILLNYGWSLDHLQRTIDILQRDRVEMAKVFVGVDVFGRSHIAGFYTHETVRRIHDCNLSVGIFAPGWTFERMPDAHPMNTDGRDEVNERFLDRNAHFWSLLWRYFFTSGPNTLPFYTSFCLGSGKRQFRSGLRISNKPWFNLTEQQYQPSVPSSFQYQYEEAYHGGSCIKFNRAVRNVRLFATDFECVNNLVVSFVFKRTDPQIEIQLILNLQNQNGDKTLMICCESDGRDQLNVDRMATNKKKFFIRPLHGQLLKYTVIGLSNRNEKIFPSSNRPINGWETRYYYLNLDDMAKYGHLIDIGITIDKNRWLRSDFVLLGALHVHSGIQDEDERYVTEHLELISFDAIETDTQTI